VRFLADMGVDLRVVEWLRRSGYDAVHLRELGWHRMPDGEIFEKAGGEGRVILTFDLDFGEIAAFSTGKRASVIVFRLQNARAAHVIERLAATLAPAMPELEEGAVVVVEETRHRIRRMPVGRG